MIVVDTGVLYAAADQRDRDHLACAALLNAHPSAQLVVPAVVVVVVGESSWLIGDRLGAPVEAAFVASVAAGDLTVADLTDDDWFRVAELTERYTDLRLGLIDASVIAVAERLDVVTVATLNDRDFNVVRPRHVAALELIPRSP